MSAAEGNAKVRAQYDLFVAALPNLLGRHAGKWAVWLDTLRGTYDSEQQALDWVDANLPLRSGVVVARVEPQDPVLLSAAWAFMPAR